MKQDLALGKIYIKIKSNFMRKEKKNSEKTSKKKFDKEFLGDQYNILKWVSSQKSKTKIKIEIKINHLRVP